MPYVFVYFIGLCNNFNGIKSLLRVACKASAASGT